MYSQFKSFENAEFDKLLKTANEDVTLIQYSYTKSLSSTYQIRAIHAF